MLARLLAVMIALALVLGALWFVQRAGRSAPPTAAEEVLTTDVDAPASLATPEADASSAERQAVAPATAATASAEDEPEEPPTPERPGPGQALLRVEVVALESGDPIAGSVVCLFGDDEDREWAFSEQSDPSRGVEGDDVVTNGLGRGEFVLGAGPAYTVRARGPSGRAGEALSELGPLREGEERDVRIAVPTTYDLDWYARVVDGETDLPLAGVEVAVLARGNADTVEELGPELARGRSGRGGRLVLRLPSWESTVARAEAPGYFFGGCRVKNEANSFDNAATVTLRRSGVLAVRVLGVDGSPAGDLEVRVHTSTFQIIEDLFLPDDIAWLGTTDAEGSCLFARLPAATDLEVDVCRRSRVLLRVENPGVRLDPGELRSVEWRLAAGCRLTGVVRDRDGRGLAGVPLSLVSMYMPLWMLRLHDGDITIVDWSAQQRSFARMETDADGRFAINDVSAGPWAIGPSEETNGLPAAQVAFEIAPGQLIKEVELEIDRGLQIHGVVLDPEGKPAREVGVLCSGKEPSHLQFRSFDASKGDGSFDLGPLLAGEYWVSASPQDPLHGTSEQVLARAGDRNVVLHLRWAGVLDGSVVDAETGEPAAASVTGGTSLGVVAGMVGEEEFEFENVLPGSYDLVARTEDGRIGVLTAVRVNERERKGQLVILVQRGANLDTKSQAQEGNFYRVAVEWHGIDLGSEYGDLESFPVPAGHVVVRWYRCDKQGGETLEHEEYRTVERGQELTLEWRSP